MYQKGFVSLLSVFVISVAVIGFLYYFLMSSKSTPNLEDRSSFIAVDSTEQPKPQLKSDYIINEVDSEWDIMISEDFNASIKIPKGTIVNKGGGFDPSNPERETSQLGLDLPQDLVNAVVVIDTGKKISRTSLEIAEEITKQTGPANFTYTKPVEKIINNATGYETYASNDRNTFAYHFVTESGDMYLDVWYFYPWTGSAERTGHEETILRDVISSFKLLE